VSKTAKGPTLTSFAMLGGALYQRSAGKPAASPKAVKPPVIVNPAVSPDRQAVLAARAERKVARRTARQAAGISSPPIDPTSAPPPAKPRAKRANLSNSQVAARVASLAAAREAFPLVFDTDRPLPLAIGVSVDIRAALGLSPSECGVLMRWWCQGPLYLRALAAPGSQRHKLDGTVVGPVAEDERAHAARLIASKSTGTRPQPRACKILGGQAASDRTGASLVGRKPG
jgi:sRNA-binding protein